MMTTFSERWLCLVLLLVPIPAMASWPFPEERIKVTPDNAKDYAIEVEFRSAPATNYVGVMVHCPDKIKGSRAFYSMEFRLVEKGSMVVSSSMDPAAKDGVVTGAFYGQSRRVKDCIVTLWYGQPFRDLLEYEVDLSDYVHSEIGPAIGNQPIRSQTNRTSSAAGSRR